METHLAIDENAIFSAILIQVVFFWPSVNLFHIISFVTVTTFGVKVGPHWYIH